MNKIAYGYGTLGTVGGMGLEYQELKPLQIGDLLGREVRRSFRTQRDSVLTGLERTAIGPVSTKPIVSQRMRTELERGNRRDALDLSDRQ